MTTISCPIPEVGQVLEPYIKTQQEVARIRSELHGNLQTYVQQDGRPLTSVNLTLPHNAGHERPIPTSMKGVRRAYLRALQAHAIAQARYDALKADLDSLTDAKESTIPDSGHMSVENTLVPLLRQREKHRRLEIIEQTCSAVVASAEASITAHLDDIVRSRAGDLPTPPTNHPSTYDDKADVASQILQLKRELLSTKRVIENFSVNELAHVTRTPVPTRGGGELAGLQNALNVLTGWMEQQLATIGDAEAGSQTASVMALANGHEYPSPVSTDEISTAYEEYVKARETLLQTLSNPQNPPPQASSHPFFPTSVTDQSTQRSSAEIILPFIHRLDCAKREEQTLQHQTAFTRKAIQSSEHQTQKLITRLSDESHLVRPGSSKGRDWAEAAAQAEKATMTYTKEKLQAGEKAAIAAEQTLTDIREIPKLFDGLIGMNARYKQDD
ncbi:hypothetical protein LTR62_003626 [Meristemomyces frigidus]|uniref:Uncharacterized protein n=1 Tax=Meristemomyces frigidus TaxID=1508187 RepID=A0AAN7TIJ1_9PEZI|nr:hypothetical protein LTR62_003626 [Meristemomyces frigidus]